MARARNIKPGFFTNEILGEADPMIGILFIGLWCLADREGRFEDRPRKIKAEILPYRDSVDVDEMLSFLARHDFIMRYEVDSVKYVQILKFDKHQAPHHLEAPSKIPPAPGFANRLNHAPIGVPQRRRIYERDGHKCVICESIDHLTIDHITPVSKGGDSSDENLRTLCRSCNCSKGNRESPKKKHNVGMTSSAGHDEKHSVFPSDSLIPDSLITDSPALRGAVAPIPIKPKKPKQTPLPEGFGISERVQAWADEKGHRNLSARLEHFVSYAKRSGKMYADWDEAFMGAIREDWAKLSSAAYQQGAAQAKPVEWGI